MGVMGARETCALESSIPQYYLRISGPELEFTVLDYVTAIPFYTICPLCVLTKAERMGRNTVRVAGLLANSVTADTSRQANSVTAHGGRPLIGSSCRPIHIDSPDTCTSQQQKSG